MGHSRLIYEGRVNRCVNRHILSWLDGVFAPAADAPLAYPPVFILGAPRSGSTLLMQVLNNAFDFGYLSNLHCSCFGCPALAERYILEKSRVTRSDYLSEHGVTRAGYEPSECGQWWYRFFRRKPPYISETEIDTDKMRKFRRSLAALTNAFERPVIFKNLYASFRVNAIAKFVPEAVFIITNRDSVDNGHSILETRYKLFGDYRRWWSLEPPNIELLKVLPPHEQVIEQIRQIRSIIDRDLNINGVPLQRRFEVGYEELCGKPAQIMDDLEMFFMANGCLVSRKRYTPLPFATRSSVRIDTEIYKAMESYAAKS